jgi:hypothetical protein
MGPPGSPPPGMERPPRATELTAILDRAEHAGIDPDRVLVALGLPLERPGARSSLAEGPTVSWRTLFRSFGC